MDLLWFIENENTGLPVNNSAEYTTLSIRRLADGYLYDWTAGTFSATGGTTPSTEYVELSLLPGFYNKTIDISTWENGNYHAVSYLNTPTLATNRVVEFTVKGGTSYESNTEAAITTSIPTASLLVQEYYNNEDIDGNGMIYGVDFYISSNRPKILDNIPKRGVGMSWESYLASI
jgi:hypothetical protein